MVDEVLPASLEKLEIDRDTVIINSSRVNSLDESTASINPFRTITRGIINKDTSYLFGRRCMPNKPTSSSSSSSLSTSSLLLSSQSSSTISPRGVKSTTNFKPLKYERVLDNKPNKNRNKNKNKKNSIIKEAVLKLNSNNGSNYLSENLASTLLDEACKLSITSSSKTYCCKKRFGVCGSSKSSASPSSPSNSLPLPSAAASSSSSSSSSSVTKDFKALNIYTDSRLVKDDTSILQEDEDDFNTSSFKRVRSNTMPSLKRGGPGPGGGGEGNESGNTSGANLLPGQLSSSDVQNSSGLIQNSNSSTCSIQARISPPPCDVTIDELASYFDEFVHIPKKMSHMAEMMYI